MSPTELTQQPLTSPVSTRSEALRFRLPGTAASVRFRQSGSGRRLSLQGRTAPTATGIGHPFTGAGPYAFARMFERRLRLDDGPFE